MSLIAKSVSYYLANPSQRDNQTSKTTDFLDKISVVLSDSFSYKTTSYASMKTVLSSTSRMLTKITPAAWRDKSWENKTASTSRIIKVQSAQDDNDTINSTIAENTETHLEQNQTSFLSRIKTVFTPKFHVRISPTKTLEMNSIPEFAEEEVELTTTSLPAQKTSSTTIAPPESTTPIAAVVPVPRIRLFSDMRNPLVSLLHGALSLARQVAQGFSPRIIINERNDGAIPENTIAQSSENSSTDEKDFVFHSQKAIVIVETLNRLVTEAASLNDSTNKFLETINEFLQTLTTTDPLTLSSIPPTSTREESEEIEQALKITQEEEENKKRLLQQQRETKELIAEVDEFISSLDAKYPALKKSGTNLQPPLQKEPAVIQLSQEQIKQRWMDHLADGFTSAPEQVRNRFAQEYIKTGFVQQLKELGINFFDQSVKAQFNQMLKSLGMEESLKDVPHWV